ncbi:mannitol dehydrogenase family protein [Xanthobacteraceae bacterium Astr-EGSB]|uniref:mannitol dehydrogenase family protein n=1 Tax=Astrobacterium formosum TaxID=3069710 RepID=UPI0027AE81D6|nr:mannitol dehydrogenase family protein [Xanthobacteraceae bacterium Astr-EGSB]
MNDKQANQAARPRLSEAVLGSLPAAVRRPRYDRKAVTPGILHIGLGAFCRAHLGTYTEDVLETGVTDWGIVGIDMLAPDIRAALKPQDCLYTVMTREGGKEDFQVVGSFLDVMATTDQLPAVLAWAVRPEIRIVTLTVTEKGYCQDPATGKLDEKHPAVVADLANPSAPRSVPGMLTELIRLRRAAGLAPFTVLVCDNLMQNGKRVRGIVTRFAQLRDPELGRFVEDNILFPCTMVDRITPATQDAERAAVAAGLGIEDQWPIVTEPFKQWVIEDHFAAGRPPWELAGATMVDNVDAFEIMKLRCLNGTHSTLAYLGVLAGIETIADTMTDPHLPTVIRRLWDQDLVPTLTPIPGTDFNAYTKALEARYRNPAIRHRTLQISSDGSQKLGPRLLEPALERLQDGACAQVIPLTVAAWMRFLLGKDDNGQTYTVSDPMADRLTKLARDNSATAATLSKALLAVGDIFPAELVADKSFTSAVERHLASLMTRGVRQTLTDFVAGH